MKSSALALLFLIPFYSLSQTPSSCIELEEEIYLNALITGKSDGAEELEAIKSCSPDDVEFLMKEAKFLYKQKEYEQAIKKYSEVVNTENVPQSTKAEASYYGGRSYYSLGNYPLAIAFLEGASTLGYSTQNTNFQIARCHFAMADYLGSIRYYEKVVAEDSTDHSAINNMGVSYERLGNDELSLEFHLKANSIAKGNHTLYLINIAKDYTRLNRWEDALRFSSEAYQRFPKNLELFDQYAKALGHFGQDEKVLALALGKLKERPTSETILFRLGWTYNELGIVDSSLYYYHKSIRYGGDRDYTLGNIGDTYCELGMFDKAHHYIDRALALNPENRKAHMYKFETFLEQYRFEEAHEKLMFIANKFGPWEGLDARIGWALLCLERYEEAIPHLQIDMDEDPSDTKPYNNMGRCYAKLGNSEKAFELFDLAIERDSNNSYIYHNRASLYLDLGEYDKACADLQRSIDEEYNWIIDSSLLAMKEEHCPEVNTNRKIVYYGFKGNFPERKDLAFIELRDSEIPDYEDVKAEAREDVVEEKADGNDAFSENFRIYPNPSTGMFFVENVGESIPANLKVYNVNAQLIQEERLGTDPIRTIDISDNPNGTYFVLISNESGVLHSSKVVLKK